MPNRKLLYSLLCGLALLASASAQQDRKNEIGLLLGGTVTPNVGITGQSEPVEIGAGLTFQATYARQLLRRPAAALYLEVPFLAVPLQNLSSSNGGVPANYDSLFVTPGVRLKLSPQSRLSPWFSLGGGYALFDVSKRRIDGSANPGPIGVSRGAVQFGAGLDLRTPIKVLVPLGLRLEARDLYSGKPNYNANTGGGFQHNVALSGGLVLRF